MNLSGSPADFLLAFSGGVLLSFTPCVYPLLPITIAYIGASSSGSRAKGFGLSLVYVTGISITYATLGLAAALTGSIFGRFSTLPQVRIISGLVIVFFGFTLWSGGGLRLPGLKLPARKSATYLSCFILGLTSGLVISPCTAPALGAILVFVAAQRNLVYGAFLLLSFAYGMGLLLVIAGTFSSILTVFPKSGQWMELIKKICAAILICAGIFFVISGIVNLVPSGYSLRLTGIAYAHSYTGFDSKLEDLDGNPRLASIAYAQESEDGDAGFDFELKDLNGNKVRLSQFRNKKPVVLFFWTTWCFFCRAELDKMNKIYPALQSEGIEVLAIDVQEPAGKVSRAIGERALSFPVLLDSDGSLASAFGLAGVPFFILIDKAGNPVFMDYRFPQDTYKDFLIDR